jgi:DHA1 family bicyclomycin/chloramphenicol resistance-like MFS transporter
MFVGLALYIVASLVSLFANSVELLVASRVVQGFGAGAGPAIGRAVVIDVYPKERAARIMAVITVSTALAPMLSPMAGGILQDLWGWRAVFVTQTIWGVALAAGYFAIFPETVPARDPTATRLTRMARNYRTLYSTRVFVTSSLLMGFLFSGHLVFISSSSFVLVDQMGLSPSVYGFAFGSIAVGIMAGATLSGRLIGSWEVRRIIVTGAIVGAASSAVMAALAQTGHSQPLLIVLPMCLTAACQGFVRPPAMSSALVPFPMMAGLASAVMGFSQIALASTYASIFTALVEPGSETMTAAIAVAGCLGLALVLLSRAGAATEPNPAAIPIPGR